ncbi:MAG: class I SAM-dependent methyltransferase [Deltaproteobacteria bacterium]|nr:class I SAM-dependent methyltransferase [Deltaproteobacteria bacterium]
MLEADIARAHRQFPGPDYMEILAWLHRFLRPRSYLEIGVECGRTLQLAEPGTRVVGVDPDPLLEPWLRERVQIHSVTSDVFFANHDPVGLLDGRVDLAFIDGLHLFEQALRDFINIEKISGPDTLIVIHDCLPLDARTSSRKRSSCFWSGDVWRIVPCLRKERPDLKLATVPAYPAGLCLVRNLDPRQSKLESDFESVVSRYLAMAYQDIQDKEKAFALIANQWSAIRAFIDDCGSRQ